MKLCCVLTYNSGHHMIYIPGCCWKGEPAVILKARRRSDIVPDDRLLLSLVMFHLMNMVKPRGRRLVELSYVHIPVHQFLSLFVHFRLNPPRCGFLSSAIPPHSTSFRCTWRIYFLFIATLSKLRSSSDGKIGAGSIHHLFLASLKALSPVAK